MVTLDLNILPIHRINGQASAELPGLLAVTPPRKTARGREQNTLIVYLTLAGNAPFSNSEIRQLVSDAATSFYQSAGSLTFAMRSAANDINSKLLGRNLAATGQGQQVSGSLVLAAMRDAPGAPSAQGTLLLSGPTHAVWVTDGGSRHIHDPALSGKGLGLGQSLTAYLSQVELRPQDLLVLCSHFPRDWEADLLNERPPTSLDASYRKLTFTKGDLNAVLIHAQSGHGMITLLRPEVSGARQALPQQVAPLPPLSMPISEESAQTLASPAEQRETAIPPQAEAGPHIESEGPAAEPQSQITDEQLDSLTDFAAHMVQPSAYAIPPQSGRIGPIPGEETKSNGTRGFPASIPRAQHDVQESQPADNPEVENAATVEEEPVKSPARAKRKRRLFKPNAHAAATRQMAKVMVGGIRSGRHVNERFQAFLQKFLPRLLPIASSKPLTVPTYLLVIIAVVIPVVVVTVASVVYFRLGQSIQYDELYGQALNARAQAVSEPDPARQRDAWQRVLNFLKDADEFRVTDESNSLRTEAQSNLDALMGVIRLEFAPAFPNGLSGSSSMQISRLAASESDLYMLDAEDGRILHANFTGRSLNLDNAFHCQPGAYAGYQVGELIDILALPKVNALGATVLGIDAKGNLLYCAPDQVAQALPLPSLPNTNWGQITAFALENDNLYVLDAPSHAVWVFPGKDTSFTDTPYFYFSNEIPVSIDSAIDLAVSNDDIFMLHTDGHLSTCTYSRITDVPTRCQDPAPWVDNFPAHRDLDIFNLAHFTQLAITTAPNSVILLLDAPNQSVFRFSPRSFELQNQVRGYVGKANPFKGKSATAMAVSPNYVLYLAIDNQVYFATNLP